MKRRRFALDVRPGAVALLAGLFIAIAIVVVSDMLNTKVRNADEVEELLGLPVIGRMPAVKGGK